MAQFKAFEPGVEVRGDVVRALINVMGAFRAVAIGILEDHGIKDPRPHHWYSQQAFLSSFETIANNVGPNTLYQIGREIPDEAFYPPGVDNLEAVFSALDTEYKNCHRNGWPGSYEFSFTGMTAARLICNTPYPCDFDRGLVEYLAHRFEPEGSFVDVRHEDNLSSCKKLGADSCTYTLRW